MKTFARHKIYSATALALLLTAAVVAFAQIPDGTGRLVLAPDYPHADGVKPEIVGG
jgi:hypothetical protein